MNYLFSGLSALARQANYSKTPLAKLITVGHNLPMEELTFAEEIRLPAVNVPRAALRFAQSIAYPELNVSYYMERLEQLAVTAATHISPFHSTGQRAEALADFLFLENGFQGNVTHYGDPRNSFLNEVLDRRLGIPISLSVIYLAVADRLEIPAFGVGLPGHFIVGVRDGAEAVYIDPFHGGPLVTEADCARLVEETTGHEGLFEEAWLEPLAPVHVLVRMLNNLRLIYVQKEAWAEALLVLQHLHQLQPESAEHLRDLGLVHYQKGNIRAAANYFDRYVAKAPDSPDATAIRQNFQLALNEWVRVN
jgi:regulator of sirC expression with transglutaminase-like and TPR domain